MRCFPLLFFLFISCVAQAEEFDAKVIAVMDGDTLMVLHDGQKLRIRLADIDAPEMAQPFGPESRVALASRVLKKQAHISSRAMDAYGRLVAVVTVDGININEVQVSDGLAWEYSHFHRDARFLLLMKQAQQERKGLWARPGTPMAPEQWRKLNSTGSPVVIHKPQLMACGKKRQCRQMISCEEARFYLAVCGVRGLDANGDGVPCEELCDSGIRIIE